MKKRIFGGLCTVSIAAVLLTSVLMMGIFYQFLVNQTKSDLRSEALILAKSAEAEGDSESAYKEQIAYFKQLENKLDRIRITLIGSDGTVLYDTDADPNHMENHNGRIEVKQARETGQGSSMRESHSLEGNLYYHAVLLSNGNVLRVARQADSVGAAFLREMPFLISMAGVILILCLFLAGTLTRRMLRPLETVSVNLEGELPEGCFDELTPFLMKIKEQNQEIKRQVEKTARERDTIRVITDNMQEGLVLIDVEKNILSANISAMEFLGAKRENYNGKNLLILTRNADILGSTQRALEGRSSRFLLETERGICQVYANPVYTMDQLTGAILLILDVTEQQKSEKIRRDFASNVSHELKTPLTSIMGYAEMIENHMVATDDLPEFASKINRESKRLLSLIEDTIRLSNIEEGAADGDNSGKEEVELQEICKNVLERLEFLAKKKEVTMELRGGEGKVWGNPSVLDELIFNLCDNGIKYNLQGGKLCVDIKRQGAQMILTVSDTGIGISEKYQGRIFERFFRVDKSRSKDTGGTGLGLAIVKHAAEYHQGTVTVKSTEGQGTTFTVTLPAAE